MAPASATSSSAQRQAVNGHVSMLLQHLEPDRRHVFLQPSAAMTDASLGIVKDTLEEFTGQVEDEQLRRLVREPEEETRW